MANALRPRCVRETPGPPWRLPGWGSAGSGWAGEARVAFSPEWVGGEHHAREETRSSFGSKDAVVGGSGRASTGVASRGSRGWVSLAHVHARSGGAAREGWPQARARRCAPRAPRCSRRDPRSTDAAAYRLRRWGLRARRASARRARSKEDRFPRGGRRAVVMRASREVCSGNDADRWSKREACSTR